jgi:hypothetical protein
MSARIANGPPSATPPVEPAMIAVRCASRPRVTPHRRLVAWLPPLLLVSIALAVSAGARVLSTGSDPWGCLLTSQALIEHGTIRLDAYADATRDFQFVDKNGHRYYFFPLGTPLLAVPYVFVARLQGANMAVRADDAAAQHVLAVTATTAASALIMVLCRMFLPSFASVLVAAAFSLGSMVMSSMASALWNFDFAVPLLLGAMLPVVRFERGMSQRLHPVPVGVLLVLAYLCRPTAAPFVVATFAFTLVRRRRDLPVLAAAFAIPLAVFAAFSWHEFGQILPDYYLPGRLRLEDLTWRSLYGVLLSPGRGLLVFCPYLFMTLAGTIAFARRLWHLPLFWMALGSIVAHVMASAAYYHWWGGWSFGSRVLTDAVPALLLLTLVVASTALPALGCVARMAAVSAFGVLTATAIFVHGYQGLYNPSTHEWNRRPDIDRYPDNLFDWGHPQFLASEAQIAERLADLRLRGLRPQPLPFPRD